MKYALKVPPTMEQGSYNIVVTATSRTIRKESLSDYNSARAHDGLEPISRMPAGTTYTPLYEWEVQGLYSHGWEVVTTEETRGDAVAQWHTYRENEPKTSFKVKRVPA